MDDKIALYVKVRNVLVKRIEKGEYPLNTLLPSERKLMEEFKVGRETARRAVSELEYMGYVRKKQGIGTFIMRQYPMDTVEPLTSFTAELEARGIKAGDRLLEKKVIEHPPRDIKKALNIEKVFYTKRIRFADNIPFAIENSYFPLELRNCLVQHHFTGSYYRLIAHKCKIYVSRISQSISSRMSTKEEIKLLSLKKETPMLALTRTWYSKEKPIYYLVFIARSDLYSFKSEVRI